MSADDPVTMELIRAGRKLAVARDELVYAKDDAKAAAKVAVDAGEAEQYVAEVLGVNRLTVRKWLGK